LESYATILGEWLPINKLILSELVWVSQPAVSPDHTEVKVPFTGNFPGHVGWGSVQPGLVEHVPDHCRGVGLDDL